MPPIFPDDPDFWVCQISFETLLEIQVEAEDRGFATRWTSVDALRSQVSEGPLALRPLMREERGGRLRAYRCLVLFSAASGGTRAIATIDLDPTRFASVAPLDLAPDARRALARMFALAMGEVPLVAKK